MLNNTFEYEKIKSKDQLNKKHFVKTKSFEQSKNECMQSSWYFWLVMPIIFDKNSIVKWKYFCSIVFSCAYYM